MLISLATTVYMLQTSPQVITSMQATLDLHNRIRAQFASSPITKRIMSVISDTQTYAPDKADLISTFDVFPGYSFPRTHIVVFYSSTAIRTEFVDRMINSYPWVVVQDMGTGTSHMGFRRSGVSEVEFFSEVHKYVALVPMAIHNGKTFFLRLLIE